LSRTEVIIQATLNPDGTLELDHKPDLPPGRVTVVLCQESPPPTQEGWWPYLQRVRAEREASGYHFMNEVEMTAHLQWLRDEEENIDRIYREIELEKRKNEQA
jgi:hypothetical protein